MVSGRDDVVADDHLSLSAGFPAFLSGRRHQISGVYREADDNLRRASHALIIFFQHPRRCRDVAASPGQGRRRRSIHVAAPAKSLRIHLATPPQASFSPCSTCYRFMQMRLISSCRFHGAGESQVAGEIRRVDVGPASYDAGPTSTRRIIQAGPGCCDGTLKRCQFSTYLPVRPGANHDDNSLVW